VDSNPDRVGTTISGIKVTAMKDLSKVVAEREIAIGIIATPGEAAQEVADRLVAAGITSKGRSVDRAPDPRLPRAAQGG